MRKYNVHGFPRAGILAILAERGVGWGSELVNLARSRVGESGEWGSGG